MLDRLFSVWFWFGSNRPGFYSGTTLLLTLILLVWLCGIHASLNLGPGGDFPGFFDLTFYALSHDELTSLLYNTTLLLWLGPCQERRWGTVTFLALAFLSTALLPPIYALFLFVTGDEASRMCGYSATQLALFTAQCSQVKQRRVLRFVPVWFLPWLLLLFGLFLLPSTPGLLHFYAICLGHNYSSFIIENLQKIEDICACDILPEWAFIPVTSRLRLPTHSTRSMQFPESSQIRQTAPPNRAHLEDPRPSQSWQSPVPAWRLDESVMSSDARVLEEQLLRAGILASLQDSAEGPGGKVEVPKSSVSSLRLQQLEKMGFPTEKAVVALAATGQLDGAISLLIHDRVGEEAVVTKGRKSPT